MFFNRKFLIIEIQLLFYCNICIVVSQINEPSETQRAQCTITAGEIQASAEATMTKTLKGVCGSKEMQLAFQELEIKLMKDIQHIKMILNDLHSNLVGAISKNQIYQTDTTTIINDENKNDIKKSQLSEMKITSTSNTKSNDIVFHKIQTDSVSPSSLSSSLNKINQLLNNMKNNNEEQQKQNQQIHPATIKLNKTAITDQSNHKNHIKLKSSHEKKINREMEIKKLNNTMLSGEEIKLFSYYWKLENFSKKLSSHSRRNNSIECSPLFSIAGKQLRIKATFNYLQRDFLHLQLEHVSNDIHNKFKNIVLETGGGGGRGSSTIFKEIEDNNNSSMKHFKHKISILNQINPLSDLESQEFINIGAGSNGFLIPTSTLKSNLYSKNDTITIKLLIYL